jgi:dihydroxy-acid dehydratase
MALDAPTATGHPWSDQLTSPTTADSTSTRTQDRLAGAIRPVSNPIHPKGSIAVLRGNLCPNGAVIKSSAASKQLMTHKGPALVFQSLSDLHGRLSDPNLKVTAQHILVLRNAGPVGAPGMPEAGGFPIPKCLAERGVKDMVRISDARMSGTAFGTIVLHIAPEAAIGGPLALVRDGDEILLDVSMRRLELLVSEEELERRRQSWIAPEDPVRGYGWIYRHHVLGPDKGCDFDFLLPTDG